MVVSPGSQTVVVSEKDVRVTDKTSVYMGQNQASLSSLKTGIYVGVIGQKTPQGFNAEAIYILPSPIHRRK